MAKKKPKRHRASRHEQPLIFLDIDGVGSFGGRVAGAADATHGEADADAASAPTRRTQRLAAIVEATGHHRPLVVVARPRTPSPLLKAVPRRTPREKLPLPTTDINYHSVRQWEIARYLEKHPARRWVALDDEELVQVRSAPSAERSSIESQQSTRRRAPGRPRGRGDSCTL